jgi:flagellar basal-body rod modification protein FlgD
MPDLGVPNSAQAMNPFKGVQLNRGAPKKEKSTGDTLNRLAGASANDKNLFVDAKKHNKMGKDEFLRLLAHQMQNQDPMNPTDHTKFTSELAQFSQLEQLTNMNSAMAKMASNGPDQQKYIAASFLGKKVVTQGSSVQWKNNGVQPKINFTLDQPARKVMVRIYDSKNQLIRQMDLEGLPKGANVLNWDGKAMDGFASTKGDYKFSVKAVNEKLEDIPVVTKATGLITGVDFQDGETLFMVDGKKRVSLRDVMSFKVADTHDNQAEIDTRKMANEARKKMKMDLPAFQQQDGGQ